MALTLFNDEAELAKLTAGPPPVDVVYTWIDGSDPEHKRQRDRFRDAATSAHRSDRTDVRWTNRNELLYSIRSVRQFAPFVRNIYVVVSHRQFPAFLDRESCVVIPDDRSNPRCNESGLLFIVNDTLIFTGKAANHLPTFNSQAIESHLHDIPGLAEHFIYLCDDMMFGKPVTRDMFFDRRNRPIVLHKGRCSNRPNRNIRHHTTGQRAARIQAHRLLARLKPAWLTQPNPDLSHQAKSATKSLFRAAWKKKSIAKSFRTTSRSRFRANNNVEIFTVVLYYGRLKDRVSVPERLSPRDQAMIRHSGTDTNKLRRTFLTMHSFTPAYKTFFDGEIARCAHEPRDVAAAPKPAVLAPAEPKPKPKPKPKPAGIRGLPKRQLLSIVQRVRRVGVR